MQHHAIFNVFIMREISTGRFLYIILILIIVSISYAVMRNLSEVLLPFFVAWLLAYLIYPIVKFFQYKLKFKHKFTPSERDRAIKIYEIVCKHNIELLEEADELMEQENNNTVSQQTSTVSTNDMTLELVQRMVEWDKKKRILEDWKWKAMNDVVQGKKPFTDRTKYAFYLNLEKLKKFGFEG